MSDAEGMILCDDDRRLNLEQQKKRAKELHRAIMRGDADALARLRRHHPDAHDLTAADTSSRARLSDAQLVIARARPAELAEAVRAYRVHATCARQYRRKRRLFV